MIVKQNLEFHNIHRLLLCFIKFGDVVMFPEFVYKHYMY